MPTIAVRLSDAERIELDDRAQGDISKYVRNALFGEAENAVEVERRLSELIEEQAVLRSMISTLADSVKNLSVELAKNAAPAPALAGTNEAGARLEGMTLELLLLLRGRGSRTELNGIQSEVKRQGLPVWEDSTPPSSFMASNTTMRKAQTEVERQDPPGSEGRSQGGFLKKWL